MCEVRRETDGRNTLQIVMRLWRGHWVGVVEDQSQEQYLQQKQVRYSLLKSGIPMLECDVSMATKSSTLWIHE
jgi:hypothetical protein